jgi:hypothetical protein
MIGVLPPPSTVAPPEPSPRGVKRSRSPESHGEGGGGGGGDGGDDGMSRIYISWSPTPSQCDGDHSSLARSVAKCASNVYPSDDQKPRKRGRPPKTKGSSGNVPESPNLSSPTSTSQARSVQAQTPQAQPSAQPPVNVTPAQTSPTKATPTKSTIKSLPTVRDHTTDQLGPDEDEYVPREYDDAGEKKVTPNGVLTGGREYRCRTFYVPNRGDKLFMLATECARVLGYRDSYLLFNKNRSLYKIIATQPEKDDLIHQEILPYSYRSRQIAIVTAKSMFRQFGSRVITGGRRVRDDYWEHKARKQGFTEDDAAGEKRPGAARVRDAAAAEAANAGSAMMGHHTDIVYNNGPHLDPHQQPQAVQPGMGPLSLAPLPMIHLAASDDMRLKDYTNVPRPRQEISGAPYLDQTKPSSTTDILNQAQQTADYNKSVGQQRAVREKYLDDIWKQPREIAATTQQSNLDHSPSVSQSLQSPHGGITGGAQQPMVPHQSHAAAHIMPQGYSQSPHPQNSLAQSPARSMSQVLGRPDQLQHRSPGIFPPSSAITPSAITPTSASTSWITDATRTIAISWNAWWHARRLWRTRWPRLLRPTGKPSAVYASNISWITARYAGLGTSTESSWTESVGLVGRKPVMKI